jgi:hypothetical protein
MKDLNSNKNKNFGEIPSNHGFSTPHNYFENLDSLILAKLKAEALNKNESTLKIPENYFDNLEENITKKIRLSSRTNKTKKIIKILAPLSIAASLLFVIFLNQFKQQHIDFNTVTTAELEFAVENGFIDFDAQTLAVAFSEIDLSDDFMSLEITTDEVKNYLENQELEYLLYEN